MPTDRLLLRDVIGGFAPGQGLRATLLLTYTFDGRWLEEGFVPDLFDRPVATALVVRDGNNVAAEAPSVRYHRANAGFSARIFHSKLGLFVAEDRALAVVGSANLTRGGLERNLELATAFEVSPSGGPRPLFKALLDYVSGPLPKEVSGSAATALSDTAVALREVLAAVPKTDECPHAFVHNYERTIWEQVIEALPHRHVARLTVVSPFFEPDKAHTEDPQQNDDAGVFERAFRDLRFEPPKGEKPVAVFFQQSEGETFLPVEKLKARKNEVELFQRLSTTAEEPRPLHAKLLLIEGARGPGREPYLVAVHGSPNFTSAAYLTVPPEGNAEIAVITRLPTKRNGSAKACSVLGLEQLFGKVADWKTLRHIDTKRESLPALGTFRLSDAALRLADRRLDLSWENATASAVELRVLIELNGAWKVIAVRPVAVGKHDMSIEVPEIAQTDSGGLLSLTASRVKVEMLDATGSVVASSVAPMNVDCPQQFCGLAMVGQLMATLDQRIASAGCGVPQTYREQQKFIEQHRAREASPGKAPTVLTHHADLDRFFRNLHSGLRGVRMRAETLPNSEYTFRRTVRDLGRWCVEALSTESKIPTDECRLFLVDRLGREIQHALERGRKSPVLGPRVVGVTQEFGLASALEQAVRWVEALPNARLGTYAQETSRRLESVATLLKDLAEGKR